jgi:hypothetical protein
LPATKQEVLDAREREEVVLGVFSGHNHSVSHSTGLALT